MKNVNIEINVCGNAEKSTCTVNPPIQAGSHTCCHSDNGGGQEPGVSGVASVFGRTGIVTAQPGDYTADQITETATRKFASPDEKAIWNAKQDALISGTTIRTLFGQSLLGSGDFSPTPAQMGVAAADHTHTTADITDYTQKTKQLIHSSLEAGTGVALSYNPVNEKTVISATGGGSGSGGSGYIVADRQGATAGQNHVFNITPQSTFNLAAYALKEVAGATNQTYVVDDFGVSSEGNYNVTHAAVFDNTLRPYVGKLYNLVQSGNFYSSPVKSDGKSIEIDAVNKTLIPAMTANNSSVGYMVDASSEYSTQYAAWTAFNGTLNRYWASKTVPTVANPHWLRITMAAPVLIDTYRITNENLNPGPLSPKSWMFQGSNDGTTWDTLHTVSNDTRDGRGAVREYTFTNNTPYSSFRILITAQNAGPHVQIGEFEIFRRERLLINGSDGKWYSANNGILTSVPAPSVAADFYETGFLSSGVIPESSLSGIQPVTIFSSKNIDAKVLYTPHPQIAIQKVASSAALWSQINSAVLTATQTGNGKVRVAVTRDLVNWHVLRSGAWVDVGALSADTVGAEALIADGMTPAEFGGITAAQWTQLFSSNNGVPDSLAFAFALDITDPVTDVATIDRLVLNVNDASSWKVQTLAEVEIRWRTDSVTFRTTTAGNYKLAYQVP
ncbi:discoidin domain-containing protein [Pectobacterium carotovorum]|uniref:discoidin domain-containing protein n=1 Tax=Pectobacterium carotovorum TaxID=554 RepID=UPI0015DE1F66|nr:discoidin domain-containing protein [Pectobacterium carotovorum]MBA0174168.1 discoidin domain-containing protein [Pectobacterium carotovorum]